MDAYLEIEPALRIRLASDRAFSLDDRAMLLLHAYVPGIRILDVHPKSVNLTIKHIESATQRYTKRGKTITIHDRWRGRISLDTMHLLHGAVRYLLLRSHRYPVHAACVGKERTVLLVGHTGVGKTTLALALVKRGMMLYSANTTVIALTPWMRAVAGTRAITVDGGSAARGLRYADRIGHMLKEGQYAPAPPARIDAIALVRLNDGVRERKRLSAQGALHALYPYIMDAVRADVIFGEGVVELPPPRDCKTRAAKDLRRALARVPAYRLSGPLRYLAREVEKL